MGDQEKIADRAEWFKGKDGKWYVRTLSNNGREILRSSEGYENKGFAVDVAYDTGLPCSEGEPEA